MPETLVIESGDLSGKFGIVGRVIAETFGIPEKEITSDVIEQLLKKEHEELLQKAKAKGKKVATREELLKTVQEPLLDIEELLVI